MAPSEETKSATEPRRGMRTEFRLRIEMLTSALHDLAVDLSAATDLYDGLRLCLDSALKASEMDSGAIYLTNEKTGELELLMHKGIGSEFIRRVSQYAPDSPNAQLCARGEPVYTNADGLAEDLRALAHAEGFKAIAITPFKHGEKALGCMNVASKSAEEVPASSRHALEAIAAQVGSAIDRLYTAEALRRSEEQLKESEQRFRSIVESSPVGMHLYEIREGDRLVFVGSNEAADRMLGLDARPLIGKTVEEAFPQLARTEAPEKYRRAAITGEPWFTERTFYENKQILGAHEVHVFQTRPKAIAVLFIDTTERKQSEERETQQRRDLSFLSDTAMNFVGFRVEDDMHRYVAEKLHDTIGMESIVTVAGYDDRTGLYRPHAIVGIGDKIEMITDEIGKHPTNITFKFRPHVEQVLSSSRVTKLKGGIAGSLLSEAHAKKLHDAFGVDDAYVIGFGRRGRVYGAVIIFVPKKTPAPSKDVVEAFMAQASVAIERRRMEVERSKMEEQLIHVQKMEAVNRLAGGIAHDFSNLLTCILGYSEILKEVPHERETVDKAAEVIGKAARSAIDLTQQLAGLTSKDKMQVKSVDVHRVILETLGLLERALEKSIRVSAALDARAPVVYGDPSQLQQVVVNLAVNARDAMPGGGEFTIDTSNVELDAGFCSVHPDICPGSFIVISFKDDGLGMDEDVRRRVFEPFFTTKEKGKGTGMGLAMVYGIVKNHGGVITVESEQGRGTNFRIYLPSADAVPGFAEETRSKVVLRGKGRILVADDEENVSEVIRAMLGRMGYETVRAENGATALSYYKEHKDEIDLVILDLDMPVMGGNECLRELKKVDPDVKVVVATGYFDGSAQAMLSEGALRLVHKPFDRVRLSEIVDEAIRG